MMPESYENYYDQHGGDEPWGVMPCGRYVDSPAEYHNHRASCRDCLELRAEYMADVAREAAAEDEYLKRKYGGAEGPDDLDPIYRE